MRHPFPVSQRTKCFKWTHFQSRALLLFAFRRSQHTIVLRCFAYNTTPNVVSAIRSILPHFYASFLFPTPNTSLRSHSRSILAPVTNGREYIDGRCNQQKYVCMKILPERTRLMNIFTSDSLNRQFDGWLLSAFCNGLFVTQNWCFVRSFRTDGVGIGGFVYLGYTVPDISYSSNRMARM